jgi:hypothetical protein
MREFSTLLTVFPSPNPDGVSFLFFADYFDFIPVKADDKAGILYKCDKVFIIELPDAATCRKFSVPLPCIIRMTDSKGNVFFIGDDNIPALADISPHLNAASLSVKCSMLYSPL